MDDALICARCNCVLKVGDANLVFVHIISIPDPTPEQLEERSLVEIQRALRETYRQLENLSASDASRENFSSLKLFFCKRCHREWIEEPVS